MRIYPNPDLQPGRAVVIADGKTVHDCWLWELMDADQPVGKVIEIHMHPDDAKSFDSFQRRERKAMRRLH